LTGRRLRFDLGDAQQGIFLVAADGSETRVERLIKVMPSEVSLIAPALPAGEYRLEVRTSPDDDGEIRAGRLESPLTVS